MTCVSEHVSSIDLAYVGALEEQNRLLRKLIKLAFATLVLGGTLAVAGWKHAQDNDITANVVHAKRIEIDGENNTKLVIGRTILGDPCIFFMGPNDKSNLTLTGTQNGMLIARISIGAASTQSIHLMTHEALGSISFGGPEDSSQFVMAHSKFGSHIDLFNRLPNGVGTVGKSISLNVGPTSPPQIEIQDGTRGTVQFGDLGPDGVGFAIRNEKFVQLGASVEGKNIGYWIADPTSGRTLGNWAFSPSLGSTFNLFNSHSFRPTLTLNGETNRIESYAKDAPRVVSFWPVK